MLPISQERGYPHTHTFYQGVILHTFYQASSQQSQEQI